jgi:hypothetical protein
MKTKLTLRFITAWVIVTLCILLLMFIFLGFQGWALVNQDEQVVVLVSSVALIIATIIALPLTIRFTR